VRQTDIRTEQLPEEERRKFEKEFDDYREKLDRAKEEYVKLAAYEIDGIFTFCVLHYIKGYFRVTKFKNCFNHCNSLALILVLTFDCLFLLPCEALKN